MPKQKGECVVIPFILDVRLVDAPAGVTQEEDHTGFLHLSSVVLTLIFMARRVQPFLSLQKHFFMADQKRKHVRKTPPRFAIWSNTA